MITLVLDGRMARRNNARETLSAFYGIDTP
jgi:hypothetical protein